MRAYITFVNLSLFSFVFIVTVIYIFYVRGQIVISRENDEPDKTKETMGLFRQKGK